MMGPGAAVKLMDYNLIKQFDILENTLFTFLPRVRGDIWEHFVLRTEIRLKCQIY